MLDPIQRRVYLDLDPGFTQRGTPRRVDMRFARHDHFVTVGSAIGRDGCRVPTCGLEWSTTLPPVVLSRVALRGGDASTPLRRSATGARTAR